MKKPRLDYIDVSDDDGPMDLTTRQKTTATAPSALVHAEPPPTAERIRTVTSGQPSTLPTMLQSPTPPLSGAASPGVAGAPAAVGEPPRAAGAPVPAGAGRRAPPPLEPLDVGRRAPPPLEPPLDVGRRAPPEPPLDVATDSKLASQPSIDFFLEDLIDIPPAAPTATTSTVSVPSTLSRENEDTLIRNCSLLVGDSIMVLATDTSEYLLKAHVPAGKKSSRVKRKNVSFLQFAIAFYDSLRSDLAVKQAILNCAACQFLDEKGLPYSGQGRHICSIASTLDFYKEVVAVPFEKIIAGLTFAVRNVNKYKSCDVYVEPLAILLEKHNGAIPNVVRDEDLPRYMTTFIETLL